MKQVAEYKKNIVKEFHELIKEYPIVGILNMQNMPAAQLQNMRGKLRDTVVMRMSRKTLIKLALEKGKTEKKDIEKLAEHLGGMPAFIFTKDNPFRLFKIIKKSRSKAPAKAGQIAPNDIVVKAGPTPFAPGPIIGELGQIGIKTSVEQGKVAVQEDTVVVKDGEEISNEVAAVLSRLDIRPMEIGLDLVAAYENGTIYTKKILDVDEEEFLNNLMKAGRDALGLAIEVGYFTKDTVIMLVQKSFNESKALVLSQDIITDMFAGEVLAKAEAQASALKDAAKIEVSEKKAEVKEETAEEKSKEEAEKPEKVEEKIEEKKEVKIEEPEVKEEVEEKKVEGPPKQEKKIEPELAEEPKPEIKEEPPKEEAEPKIEKKEIKEAVPEPITEKSIQKVEEKEEIKEEVKPEVKEPKVEEKAVEVKEDAAEEKIEEPKVSIEEKPKEEEKKDAEESKVEDKVKSMVEDTKEEFDEVSEKEEKEETPGVDKLVKDLKDHVEGKEIKAEDLIKEASLDDIDIKKVEDIVKKIQKGENPMDAASDDVPSIHDLAKKKKKEDNN